MEGPLVLDFQGVDMATSSFMDELCGKLYKYCKTEYIVKLRFINLSQILLGIVNSAMIDQVIK